METSTWEKGKVCNQVGVRLTTDSDKQPDFYATLWSLQKYFAHPPALGGPAVDGVKPFEIFRQKSDFVLSRLYEQTKRERVLRGRNGSPGAGAGATPSASASSSSRKRPRDDEDPAEEIATYPRYLTARSLLEYEIADQQFRRQILLQYFILFQLLLNLTPGTANKQQYTGGMPKGFVIDGENQAWVKNTVSAIRDELKRMDPHGKRFEETVVQLMNREHRYVSTHDNIPANTFRRSGKTTHVPKKSGPSPQSPPTWPRARQKSGSANAAPCAAGRTASARPASRAPGTTGTRAWGTGGPRRPRPSLSSSRNSRASRWMRRTTGPWAASRGQRSPR